MARSEFNDPRFQPAEDSAAGSAAESADPQLESLLDQLVIEDRTQLTPSGSDTERFLQRLRPRVRTELESLRSPPAAARPSGWMRWAAVVPLLIAGAFWLVSEASSKGIPNQDQEIVEVLDELRLLQGLSSEDLQELEPQEIVSYLESFQLLEEIDPELLEES